MRTGASISSVPYVWGEKNERKSEENQGELIFIRTSTIFNLTLLTNFNSIKNGQENRL